MEINWKLIESAPKDGTLVLVCTSDRHYTPETAYYGTYHPNARGKPQWRTSSMRTKIQPTHWKYLPKPPGRLHLDQKHWTEVGDTYQGHTYEKGE